MRKVILILINKMKKSIFHLVPILELDYAWFPKLHVMNFYDNLMLLLKKMEVLKPNMGIGKQWQRTIDQKLGSGITFFSFFFVGFVPGRLAPSMLAATAFPTRQSNQ